MPGGSSAVKEEPVKLGTPAPLLGAAGGVKAGAGEDDHVDCPELGRPRILPATAPAVEGARLREKYSLVVRIFTAHNRRSLEPHAWVEDLLKDFFQTILGVDLSVVLLRPTECLIFCGNRTQGQGMSYDDSLRYIRQLTGLHPWTGYMIDVTAYQRTLKEARYEMQVAREFTHEPTKQRIMHLNALAQAPATKIQPATPQSTPRGRGMTTRADRFFIQQRILDMHFDEPAYEQCPPLLGTQQASLEQDQFDPAREDVEEDDDGTTTGLDAEFGASTGGETEASGCSGQIPSMDGHRRRNRAMQRERARA